MGHSGRIQASGKRFNRPAKGGHLVYGVQKFWSMMPPINVRQWGPGSHIKSIFFRHGALLTFMGHRLHTELLVTVSQHTKAPSSSLDSAMTLIKPLRQPFLWSSSSITTLFCSCCHVVEEDDDDDVGDVRETGIYFLSKRLGIKAESVGRVAY